MLFKVLELGLGATIVLGQCGIYLNLSTISIKEKEISHILEAVI
jgi:hypothetical protein